MNYTQLSWLDIPLPPVFKPGEKVVYVEARGPHWTQTITAKVVKQDGDGYLVNHGSGPFHAAAGDVLEFHPKPARRTSP